jgi:hypothetical protein
MRKKGARIEYYALTPPPIPERLRPGVKNSASKAAPRPGSRDVHGPALQRRTCGGATLSQKVTGPSLVRLTSMWAPKRPLATLGYTWVARARR